MAIFHIMNQMSFDLYLNVDAVLGRATDKFSFIFA